VTLAHSEHELESLRRWANAILVNRIDSELMTAAEIKKLIPLIKPRRAAADRRRIHPAPRRHVAP
jgi:L-2-hydroxyglutarate oxidase LhgO